MREVKPLIWERRKYWAKKFGFWDCACVDTKQDPEPCLRCLVQELFEAEQYWREAVKSTDCFVGDDYGEQCVFCGEANSMRHTEHKTDCAWKLAQD